MNTNKQIEQEATNLVEFEGLSNDEKKAIKAYNNVVHKGLTILQGKPLKPQKTVPSGEIANLMEEFLTEQVAQKKEEFKLGFKELLTEKTTLDTFVKEQQKLFNRAVVAKKKEFTKKANQVLNVLGNIEEMKANYLQTLTQNTDEEEE